MTILQLIFLLVEKFVPIPPATLAGLKSEGQRWEFELEQKETNLSRIYKKINGPWYMRLLWAVLYMPMLRWMSTPEVDVSLDENY